MSKHKKSGKNHRRRYRDLEKSAPGMGDLIELTKDFPFSEVEGEREEATESDKHYFRLKKLLSDVEQMAIKRYYDMPENTRPVYGLDDWIQNSMRMILRWIVEKTYDPNKSPFNKYVYGKMPNALTDFQREVYRKNPAHHEKLRKAEKALRRELGAQFTVEKFAEYAEISYGTAQAYLDGDHRYRIMQPIQQEAYKVAGEETTLNPEEAYIRRKETWDVFIQCLEGLPAYQADIIIKRYLEGIPAKKLPEIFELSERTIRRYNKEAKQRLWDCIQKRYALTPAAEEVT